MSIARRLAQVFRGRSSAYAGQEGDPREVLDNSYERQLEVLTRVRRGVADVITSRKRLELQLNQLRSTADRLRDQAAGAVDDGRDDAARDALTRRAGVLAEIDALTAQRDMLLAEEDKLSANAARLQARVEAFRSRKEAIKANYTAAEAQNRIGEALAGMSEEMGDVNLAMQRAEEHTLKLRARAQAVDELMASGAVPDASRPGGGGPQAALDAARHGMDAEAELAALKARRAMPAGAAPAGELPGSARAGGLPDPARAGELPGSARDAGAASTAPPEEARS